ncbi:hypothetical protein B0H13DRAFT_2053707 [Mycena leptocephala]|nr:hypothetical protein B0H13DRAFT_2053707 [Mycena leptocephala]
MLPSNFHPRWNSFLRSRPYSTLIQRRRRPCFLSTLNPSRLGETDFIDISGAGSVKVFFSSAVSTGRIQYMRGHGAQRHPFPANTRGFLYFKPQNELSPLAGGLRFRLTDTPHTDSFSHGRDLLWPFGDPWQLTFVQIAIHNSHQHFLNQILRDGFVSASKYRHCREIFANQKRIHPRFMLFSMAQPFVVDLASKPSLCVVGAKEVRTTRLTTTFTDLRGGSEVYYPFEGSARVRFERSTTREHRGRRVVVLRILEILRPVVLTVPNYAGRVLPPVAGELLTVISGRDSQQIPRPWAFDVDRLDSERAAGLRILWDN